jgi:hypothetical protein
VSQCRDEEKGRWNGSSWDLSFAPSWISEDGGSGSIKWNGAGIWTSLSIGSDMIDLFSDRAVGDRRNRSEDHYAQVILHGRYRFKEREAESATTATGATTNDFAKQDTWLVGARLRLLFPTKAAESDRLLSYLGQGVGISFEGSLSSTDVTGSAKTLKDDTYLRWALVPTLRIAENVWIDIALGTESGRKGNDQAFVLSSIKYGYGEGPWPSHQAHGAGTTAGH